MTDFANRADTAALVYAYARAVDERNLALLESLMRPDVRIAGPGFEARSCREFLDTLRILERYERTYHLVGNHAGEWSADEFRGETYCIASHLYRVDGAARKFDMGIRYGDHIVREDARLLFRERVLAVIWTQDLPATVGMPAS
ncbi:MAG TPA: nuclear transport factor 2 family protein [Steroidobacteraceae bacterium]|nr:nuclear transport factor 2 family protein [Steroidobacteraceae bacterium]